MQITDAIRTFRTQQIATLRQSTQVHYVTLLVHFLQNFDGREIESITSGEIGQFLESQTGNKAKSTRRLTYAQLKAFFNFLINECLVDIKNPCSHPLIARQYKNPKPAVREILDKELVDQLIYSTKSDRDRLILELQARCGLRIGEVLKLRAEDVTDRKLTIHEPKSGKESEIAFMPEQIAKRLAEYIFANQIGPNERVFPVCYSTVRALIRRLAAKFHVKISPHDFRRHSATYASRNGVPLEIVSKVCCYDTMTSRRPKYTLAKLTIPRQFGGWMCFTGSKTHSMFQSGILPLGQKFRLKYTLILFIIKI